MKKLPLLLITLFIAGLIGVVSCEGPEGPQGPTGPQGDPGDRGDQGNPGVDGDDYPNSVVLKAHSLTPSLLKKLSGFENIETYPLISSEDLISGFTFGGTADGIGLLKLNTGYSMLVNHEHNFAVSRVYLDPTFKPISGEYILNSSGAQWQLCSATLATPEVHGFGPLYFTCGESSSESRTHALNPFAQAAIAGQSRELPAFGRWKAENAVPLPKTAYPGKTVIIIGDDDFGAEGGQLVMYYGEGVGNLTSGSVHVLRRVDQDPIENNILESTPVNVEFVKIDNAASLTGAELNVVSTNLKSIAFNRVEDIDYRKDNVGREVYFNAPGFATNTATRTKFGRTYKLTLDATNPLVGTLECILDGDKRPGGKASSFENVDNILATQNYLYLQEDPNNYTGADDETHDAYIYQYNLSTKELKPVFELNHYRNDPALGAKFSSITSDKGTWEYGGFIDISGTIGIENTFLLCIQPHTWQSEAFRNPDGGSLRADEKQGSMIMLIKGLPR